jgi:hypothetical protein
MDNIKDYLLSISTINDKEEKVNVIIDLFNYILTAPEFIAKEAKFRLQLDLKIDDLSKEIEPLQLQNKKKFYKLIKILKKFLNNLKSRNDYVSLDNYNKIIKITI